jgi:general secretion pathway protein G
MQRTFPSRPIARRRAFTLIEVMIAIAIVVALIAIVGINVIGQRDTANQGQAKIQMSNIENGLQNFYLAFNRFPTDDEGLAVLWSRDALVVETEEEEALWQPFLEKPASQDPWRNEWGYRSEPEFGMRYDLWSNGPDGEEGTDDDITNWTDEDEAGGFSAPPAG